MLDGGLEAADATRAAQEAGLEIPDKQPDGRGARGFRPGWEPGWPAATARRDGPPLEQHPMLSPRQRRRRRAVVPPRDSRSACRLRRLPRAPAVPQASHLPLAFQDP
ncbi:hypothetical protein AV521_45305 [Streptomyces sp. IMTB 2501]|nr:hypothetical protein AV521_45305 [Streptomyces sp. IMTB 2501]